ncbi:MAG: IMP cyclohydrolase [Oscillospiraceae bacterium]|jgi:IMP cyclohydrolase|nr:IMP cyclohydrolase [Oscillospiraceae bacterium]
MKTPHTYLSPNPYPGRGILLGLHSDAAHAVVAYFIMGRSENSRNRIFVTEGSGIRTQAYDPAKLVDPSLVIYAPVRIYGGNTIVTNGDQTDTIWEFLSEGKTFEAALRTRTFEPDAPNFTPRISGIVTKTALRSITYKLSILKSDEGRDYACQRFFYEYDTPIAGEGHLIHTYRTDGTPIPAFAGEPARVAVSGSVDAFSKTLWNALNTENRVALFVRYISVTTGETQTRIINRWQ